MAAILSRCCFWRRSFFREDSRAQQVAAPARTAHEESIGRPSVDAIKVAASSPPIGGPRRSCCWPIVGSRPRRTASERASDRGGNINNKTCNGAYLLLAGVVCMGCFGRTCAAVVAETMCLCLPTRPWDKPAAYLPAGHRAAGKKGRPRKEGSSLRESQAAAAAAAMANMAWANPRDARCFLARFTRVQSGFARRRLLFFVAQNHKPPRLARPIRDNLPWGFHTIDYWSLAEFNKGCWPSVWLK